MSTKMKPVTCPKCGLEHENREEVVKHGTRYYCIECAPKPKDTRPKCNTCNTVLDMETAQVRREKGKDVLYCPTCCHDREIQARAHKELLDYIYETHNYREKQIGGEYIVAQIKILKGMYPHYKETGMLASLKYYYEVLGNDVHPNPFKLIPYIYEDAKEFYQKKRAITRHYMELKNEPKVEREPIIVESKPFKPNIKAKLIDLDSI